MGKFYTDVNSLDETKISLIFSKYIENNFNANYYSTTIGTGLIINKDRYDSGDYIRAHYNSTNPYFMEGKVLIEGLGSNGECIKSRPLKYMINNEAISCGLKLVKKGFSESIYQINFLIFNNN